MLLEKKEKEYDESKAEDPRHPIQSGRVGNISHKEEADETDPVEGEEEYNR